MSLARIVMLVVRDLRVSPRSPVLLWVILMPFLFTFLFQIAFMTLLDPKPRLGIADLGGSRISTAATEMQGIRLTLADDAVDLRDLVQSNDVDAGLVLGQGFDAAVRSGARPELEFYLSGESLASSRFVLTLTALDLVRDVEGKPAPVEIVVSTAGDGDVPSISDRLIPSILVYVLLVAGIFVPAFMLVQERENRTLDALLVTPVTMFEVLVSKAVLGFVLVLVMAYSTLALNGVFAAEPLALLVTLAVAAFVCIEIGLIYGTLAGDAKTLYTLVKSLNLFLFGPVIFYLFPSWPQWIAKLFPTYWFIDPLYQTAVRGASIEDVRLDLAAAMAIGIVLVLPILFFAHRLHARLGAT